jgi:hypothetical protein
VKVDDGNEAPVDHGPETAYAGRFDPLEMPILIELLGEHGIFAMTKAALEEGEANIYPLMGEGRRILMVDRERIAEAKRIIEDEMPARLAEMRDQLGEEPGALPDDLAPFGWFSPDVARVLLYVLDESGIKALPEYPLDGPAPPYARPDGRVRVHVETLFVDVAEEIVANELEEELVARGVEWEQPLRGDDDS